MTKRFRRWSSLLTVAVLLATCTGCVPPRWLVSSVAFGTGLLLGTRSVPVVTETHCYRNGVEIDCSALPQFQP